MNQYFLPNVGYQYGYYYSNTLGAEVDVQLYPRAI